MGESRTLARRERGDQSQSMDRKGQTPQLRKAGSKEEKEGKQGEPF